MDSGLCERCGSTGFNNIDGLFYCQTCGEQVHTMAELEEDAEFFDALGPSKSSASLLRTPREKKEKERTTVPEKKVDCLSSQPSWEEGNDYPRFLSAVGRRLATAALILVKVSRFLEAQLQAPPTLHSQTLVIYQRYLATLGVAFVDDEVTDEKDNQMQRILTKTTKQVKEETAILRRAMRENRKKEKEIAQSQMSLFEQAETNDPDQALTVDVIQEVNSKLSARSIKQAGRLHLGLEVLLNICWIACQLVGLRSVLLSDLQRWHREDRFEISKAQVLSLMLANDYSSENLTGKLQRRMQSARTSSGVDHLCVEYSYLTFIVQVVRIPQVLCLPNIFNVLRRLVYDLNLPESVMSRVRMIYSMMPEVQQDLPVDALHHTFPIQRDNLQNILQTADQIGPKSFLKLFIGFDKETGEIHGMIPIETKALALLCFTLVMLFDRDLASESEECLDETFECRQWLHQLQMRNRVRLGIAVEQVLNAQFSGFSRKETESMSRWRRMGRWNKTGVHSTGLPSRKLIAAKARIFHDCFAVDIGEQRPTCKESLFAPSRDLQNCTCDGDESELSGTNFDIFYKSFQKSSLPRPSRDDVEQRISHDSLLFHFYDDQVMIESKAMHTLWEGDRKLLHSPFVQLIDTLSMYIGEKAEMLYLTYVMVEFAFFCSLDNSANTEHDSDNNDESFCLCEKPADQVMSMFVQRFW